MRCHEGGGGEVEGRNGCHSCVELREGASSRPPSSLSPRLHTLLKMCGLSDTAYWLITFP